MYAFIAAGRTLVDGRFTAGDGICISRAIGEAATCALRLRQHLQNAVSQTHCIQAVARRRLLTGAVLLFLTLLPMALTTGFFAAAFLVLG